MADIEAAVAELKKGAPEQEIDGDGNAAWIPPMTDEEYAVWLHEQEQGWRKVYDMLLRIGNKGDNANDNDG